MNRISVFNFCSSVLASLTVVGLLAGCGGSNDTPLTTALSCDDGLKTSFKPDGATTVTLVKQFRKGDAVALSGMPASPVPPVASADMCLVKLNVGPGNPGPAGAPSTSPGIGMEIWLPSAANWNERIRAFGNGGWSGSAQASLTQIGAGSDGYDFQVAAVGKGFVVGTTDNGHTAIDGQYPPASASFAMKPDGTINTALWKDFSERSLHELALKSKALAAQFYGKPHKYAYWEGFSTGGRQGLKLAQVYPDDFDGIIAGAPAINWTRFITNELYPQVSMQRELGAPMPSTKVNAVTAAAISACGGSSLGFLLDPYACRYDPTRDASALCVGAVGTGGVTGVNSNAAQCVTAAEAKVINRTWYGQTSDGSVPDPSVDNASGPFLMGNNQLWFGLLRGSDLTGLAGQGAFPIATDLVALELQKSSYASSAFFVNATGNGLDQWKTLDYTGLTLAGYQGLVLQSQFANINTDNPDLSGFTKRNGKLIMFHGLADNLIAPQGSDNYYNRVLGVMGGLAEVQKFFRYYHVPGFGHAGTLQGAPNVPVPQTAAGRDEMFVALQAWVEAGTAPSSINVTSSDSSTSLPLCVYPAKVTYSGAGSPKSAASYSCQ